MTSASITSIDYIEKRIAPLRARLGSHPVYSQIKTVGHLRTFMESHVFAVWDFMSLLTALQQQLTCVSTPWVPARWPRSCRFINEIVLGEESDTFEGRSISHFELYLEAMEECGADSRLIRKLLTEIRMAGSESNIDRLMKSIAAPPAARRFVQSTFDVIQSGSLSALAAAFTFGREDVIPDMFRELVRDLNKAGDTRLRKFTWYLERHIELDGDDHGPLSLQMVADVCGADEALWTRAAEAAEQAISARLAFWDAISASLTA